jgi:hypothetical protein
MNIDQLITLLQEQRAKTGGDTPVVVPARPVMVQPACFSVSHTGKADALKLVSRGGMPCVLIGS